jgi:nucleotide-binding universal stress UspA family protein
MKKVVICMPLDEQLQKNIFATLKTLTWLDQCSVDFVHIFKQESFPYMLPPTVFPDQAQANEIQKTLVDIFQGLTQDLNLSHKQFHVAFDESPKAGMVSYLKKNKAEMVITFVREKHGIAGFFASSFTEHLVAHSPCSVLALR